MNINVFSYAQFFFDSELFFVSGIYMKQDSSSEIFFSVIFIANNIVYLDLFCYPYTQDSENIRNSTIKTLKNVLELLLLLLCI